MAVVDYHLKLDGIEGESEHSLHKNEIDVESWSWGEQNAGSSSHGGGSGAGKVQMQDFHFVMKANKASPKLALACATGAHIPKAVLVCRKAGGEQQEFLTVTMSDLLVSSYQTGGSAHGDDPRPLDQISINFSKIEWKYQQQDTKGNVGKPVITGFDVKAFKKI
jgi:type VI secretion system secreted protein Hcp